MRTPGRWLLAIALLAGCGDPLVGEGFRGTPLFSFQGRVMSYVGGSDEELDFRVSLFWSPAGKARVPVEQLVEQRSASVRVRFPSTFEIHVFYPPEEHHLVDGDDPFGLALVLVYQDNDGNGRFTPGADPSELVGGALDRAVLYAPVALEEDQSPTGFPVIQGFSLIDIPVNCGQVFQPVHGDQPCGESLGLACTQDADCGPDGVCLTDLGISEVPGGYCTALVGEQTCAPASGVVVPLGSTYLLESCTLDSECTREGYTCSDLDRRLEHTCNACWPVGERSLDNATCTSYQNWYADPDCGMTLGQACDEDEDCAYALDEGLCLQQVGEVTFPDGYCTHRDPSFGCAPLDTRYLVVYTDHWFLGCDTNNDCRTEEGYTCDSFYRACIPRFPMQLEIHPGFRVEREVSTLCYE